MSDLEQFVRSWVVVSVVLAHHHATRSFRTTNIPYLGQEINGKAASSLPSDPFDPTSYCSRFSSLMSGHEWPLVVADKAPSA